MIYSRYNTILFTKILHFFCDLNLIDGWIIFQLFKKNPSEFFPVAQKAAIIRQTFGCLQKDVYKGCEKFSDVVNRPTPK